MAQARFHFYLTLLLLLWVRESQAQRPSLDDIARKESPVVSEQSEAVTPEFQDLSRPFRGYTKYRALLSAICQRLDMDERRIDLVTILNKLSTTRRPCRECDAFFQTFLTSCRSARSGRIKITKPKQKKGAVEKKVTPTPVASPAPERDPHAAVIDAVSVAFIAISEDSAVNEVGLAALDELSAVLEKGEGLTPAGREYFQTVNAFIQAPFRQLRKRHGGSYGESSEPAGEALNPLEKQEKLDSLF